ncbi:hypothetical protein B0J13DRAFT_274255 [Dactylonectria estremocensis]|uniref:C2H2-type domain-containing protein n=1 Tax=Dactylonectria estremocensis TaxID=1079267 RepID=A0A9P9F0T3_9HYPO|nr:hypothetical protein B0J13DRAFT_274255 [Dactylonectria estremocensis]
MNLKRRSQRTAPFLQQNWTNGVNSLQNSTMGLAVSTPKHHAPYLGDDDGAPAQKRRRLSSPNSLEVDHLIASPRASDERSTLRIEVLRVFHKDSKRVKYQNVLPRDILTTKGSCRITIFDVSSSWDRVLHCQSQVCDITTYKNPVGPHRVARIDLPHPFFVPEDSILINRLDDDTHDISESYKLVVELEAAGDGPWPPLECHDFGIPVADQGPLADTPKRHWVMSSEVPQVHGRSREPIRLKAGYDPKRPSCHTDYVMDVLLKWTSGFRAYKLLDKGSVPCINAIDPEADAYTQGRFELNPDDEANGINGHTQEDSSHDLEDDLEGDQTPSRSLRVREKNKVYNLKVLSDQAQGKERKRRARAAQATASEGRVTYYLPTDQPVALDFYRCVTCGALNQSVAHLQVHLETHSSYEYVLETTSQGPQFRVSTRLESPTSPTRTYQLGLPVKPFNLETYAAGDHSWVTSRFGPENNTEPIRSPTKSAAARQLFEKAMSKAASPAAQVEKRIERPKILIPDTGRPLFDPVSKARLKPGDEVPKAIKDNAWMIQKHREGIAEFSDVTPAEKEFVRKWDAFMLDQSLTTSAYFPRVWLSFVRDQAFWLASSKHRMTEFAKHTSVLFARNVLDDKTVNDAFGFINEERAKARQMVKENANGTNGGHTVDTTPRQSPRASQIRKGSNGCTVCQLPVLGPRLLLCSNKACSNRLYHSDCVQENAITPITHSPWLCNTCTEPKKAS